MNNTYVDLACASLVEHALRRNEAKLANDGALVVATGNRTGPSPADRFIVEEPSTADLINWGSVNRPFAALKFDALWERAEGYLAEKDRFEVKLHVGADPCHYLAVKVLTETAWHSLLACNLFIRPEQYNPADKQEWEILHVANFVCDAERDGTRSDAVVLIHFAKRQVLMAGMHYGGELKKAMFTVQNFLLTERDVLPMHCAANVGEDGETCLFFGFSGTGKTTLAADDNRYLLGDDEHGWGKGSVFNLEGGCYVKCTDHDHDSGLTMPSAVRFGAIIENVMLDERSRQLDYGDVSLNNNARCCYPLTHVNKRVLDNRVGEPKVIIFLTCDLLGVLPPVSLLTKESAVYHFLSGYTSRLNKDHESEVKPKLIFSKCFGAPYFPRPATDYAELLIKRLADFRSKVYLVNTGWMGGSFGVGQRYELALTRTIIRAIQAGELVDIETEHLEALNLDIPRMLEGIDTRLLNPRNTWTSGEEYDRQARHLIGQFIENFKKFDMPEAIVQAGPKLSQCGVCQ